MNNNFHRRLRVESLENRLLLAGDCFQNPINQFDVNADQVFNIGDTRALFVGLNSDNVAEGEDIQTFNDVNGDGSFSVSDLRSLLNATFANIESDVHAALDNALHQVSDAIDMSGLMGVIDNLPNVEIPSEVYSALSDAYNTVHTVFDDIASDLSNSLYNAYHIVDDALADLDSAVSNGLQNSSDILDSIQSQVDQALSGVNQNVQEVIDHALNGSNGSSSNGSSSSPFAPLAGPVSDFLDTLGVDDLSDQIEDFIYEVEEGDIILSDDGYYVYDLVADFLQNPGAIASLLTANQDRLRDGAVDILNAYEDAGYDLPDVAFDLRAQLESGASLLSIYVNLLTLLS